MTTHTPLAIDKTVTLDVNGTTQRVRMCAERPGLPPLLVVRDGPGLPILHETAKYRRHLGLERDFLVTYWEQRGCGPASRQDAESASFQRQVDDLRFVLRWLHQETQQPAVVLGISIGGTMTLRAVEQEADHVKAIVVVSPDANTARSDAAASAFLEQHSQRAGNRRLARQVATLGQPPYVDPAPFQKRTTLLVNLGGIERGRTFNALLREALFSMIRTYGIVGTIKTVRNLNILQRRLLPDIAPLDLLTHPPRLAVPVHYLFGEQDALTPAAIVKELPAATVAPAMTVQLVPDARHMVHFDQPDIVRSVVVRA